MAIPAYALAGCAYTIDTITSFLRTSSSSSSSSGFRGGESYHGGASYNGSGPVTHPRLKGASSRLVGMGADDYDAMQAIADDIDPDHDSV